MGARHAAGPVLTYLDSHCECAEGWLEPLLDRIARDNSTVVSPVIELIRDDDFALRFCRPQFIQIGGFSWSLEAGYNHS
ncbi:putative polypeptide N-acetylgalactosaminyltransferase 9 isoform X1 [Diaphorina citri]|uniref:Polypeptide N-acetylgalactosaminyltransferase 9 isoform X1 n=2 Tax=Diaphorina citri TaxID=121845 RepID=A0A3Q0J6L4_DIACI|nr:putative polypeptide N-acetylgalactosaminyltransferase 9 isoform X1 [Diaphorina citri]